MAYRIYFACDIVGCKTTGDRIMSGTVTTSLPDGWIALSRPGREHLIDGGLVICPEHAKLFPPERKEG